MKTGEKTNVSNGTKSKSDKGTQTFLTNPKFKASAASDKLKQIPN